MSFDAGAAIEKILELYSSEKSLGDVPIEVERIRRLVCGYSQVDRIDVQNFKYETRHLIAQVQFMREADGLYKDTSMHASIYFSASLNECWRRYVVCKEIMHCVLDDTDAKRTGSVEDVKLLGESLVNRAVAVLSKNEPFYTEIFAEILATEILFPVEIRESYVDDYRANRLTDMQIALRLKIPESIVRSALTPLYMDLSRTIRGRRFAL